jgi:hypothetical protein
MLLDERNHFIVVVIVCYVSEIYSNITLLLKTRGSNRPKQIY